MALETYPGNFGSFTLEVWKKFVSLEKLRLSNVSQALQNHFAMETRAAAQDQSRGNVSIRWNELLPWHEVTWVA
jgi:hypothetical protein